MHAPLLTSDTSVRHCDCKVWCTLNIVHGKVKDVKSMKPCSLLPRKGIIFACLALPIALMGCHDGAHLSEQQIALGERLFQDHRLSADGSVACITCHDPQRAFTDGKAVSIGVQDQPGTRNAPSLLGLRHVESFFWDGREKALAQATTQPFSNPAEMGMPDIGAVVRVLQQDAEYSTSFAKAFPSEKQITANSIAHAIGAYLYSLPEHASRYDAHLVSGSILNNEERKGLDLFQGKAECSQCHLLQGNPHLFTDHRFHHSGVSFDRETTATVDILRTLDDHPPQQPLGHAILSDRTLAEAGRFAATRKPEDLNTFRTPSLRNVALTAPYMHDGSIGTLEQALEHEIYYRGLSRGYPISLTNEEKRQLLAFMNTLTDPVPAPETAFKATP